MCKCPCLSCATPAPPRTTGWRLGTYNVLFGSQILSRVSIGINITFIVLILASVVVVLVDSLQSIKESLGSTMNYVELCFSILFTLEYVVRLLCVRRCWMYMISFMGIIDLLSAVPALFALLYAPLATLVLLRILKISRIFRLFKLIGVFRAYSELLYNVERNLLKMVVFVIGFWSVCIVLGGFMHLLELDNPAFDNMFKAVYWAVVTLTTVGYGDAVPISDAGQVLAAVTMTLGYTFVVLGLRNQIGLPGSGANGGSDDDEITDGTGNDGGSGGLAYVTMGDEVRLDGDDDGVEMQATSPLRQARAESDATQQGGIARKTTASMRQMISFPDDEGSGGAGLAQQILTPSHGVYVHHGDDDGGGGAAAAAAVGRDDTEGKGADDDDDDGLEDDAGYRRTYDHSL